MSGAWNFCVGEIVKVKDDAYAGDVGKIHNGRLCKVIEVRYGDVIVCSIDFQEPELDRTWHSPHKLEKVAI